MNAEALPERNPDDIIRERYEVQSEIHALEERKLPLVNKKKALELEMANLAQQLHGNGHLADHHFQALMNKRNGVKRKLVQCESEIAIIKQDIRRWRSIEDTLHATISLSQSKADLLASTPEDLQTRLVTLRNKYLQFAEDHTRVNSMRMIAAQIANELTEIISTL